MYIPTDIELEKLTHAAELIDELYDRIGKDESYDTIEDFGIHYQLGKISDTLHFSLLQVLLKRKGLL